MAQLLQHQDSNLLCNKNHFGCMSGLLPYLDHSHLYAKKSLKHSESGDAKQLWGKKGARFYIPLTNHQNDESSGAANLMVSKRNSGKALRDSILKKLFGKLQPKQKMLPVTPHLLRTFSIHHLECDDYILPEEMTIRNETTVELQTSDSQPIQQDQLFENEINSKICGSANVVKHVGHDDLVETEEQAMHKEKLHAAREAHKELHLKIEEDPNSVLESYSTDGQTSSSVKSFNNSDSFPTHLLGTEGRKRGKSNQIASKENPRISMDGLLHKIPYGEKVSREALKRNLFRSASAKSDGEKVHHKTIHRSRSLTESLDQYSSLLNSCSVRESKMTSESLNSINKYSSLQDKDEVKNYKRLLSNPEYGSYHSDKKIQKGLFRASLSLNETAVSQLDVDGFIDTCGFSESKLVEPPLRVEVKMETTKSADQIAKVNFCETADEQPLLNISVPEDLEMFEITETSDEHGIHFQFPNNSFLDSESYQIEQPESNEKGKSIASMDKLPRVPETDPSAEPTKQSQISNLDPCFEEGIAKSSKYIISEDSILKSLHLKDLTALPELVNSLDVTASSSNCEAPDGLSTSDSFYIQLDQEDEAEFKYVRDTLMKSNINSSEFIEEWYPQYQPHDPFLFGKVVDTFDESETASLDHLLLTDLINEVLLETYEKCFLQNWFLLIHPSPRTIPLGRHLLKEVWMKISKLLNLQRQSNHTLQNAMAQDSANDNRWLNSQWEAEAAGMELECLVLGDLLDELLLELIDI
ncbi:hypothetical protein ZIOFF_000241 [Zingiber officinale]|uniref:DUF4378 domain-containing protein n=1 Tax=Zingiber officinale TaxID=94328 RepID=A0A8J5LXT2_ZINOF|nr:hypothetical protein ZIOFF_000241 [Zingiber officinale]